MQLPEWVDPIIWDAYLEMRKKIRKPATDYAQKLVIRKLERLWDAGHHPSDVLEQSILMSWQDVYKINQPFEDRKSEELNRELRAGTGPQVRRIN